MSYSDFLKVKNISFPLQQQEQAQALALLLTVSTITKHFSRVYRTLYFIMKYDAVLSLMTKSAVHIAPCWPFSTWSKCWTFCWWNARPSALLCQAAGPVRSIYTQADWTAVCMSRGVLGEPTYFFSLRLTDQGALLGGLLIYPLFYTSFGHHSKRSLTQHY